MGKFGNPAVGSAVGVRTEPDAIDHHLVASGSLASLINARSEYTYRADGGPVTVPVGEEDNDE